MCHQNPDDAKINTKEWADVAEPGKEAKSNQVKNQNESYNIRKAALGPNGKR